MIRFALPDPILPWPVPLYASALLARGGSDAWVAAAAMVGAVTAPIAYLQKVVFEAYIASKDPQ